MGYLYRRCLKKRYNEFLCISKWCEIILQFFSGYVGARKKEFKGFPQILSAIRQNGESQNEGNKKTKHDKFSEKPIFLTPWYASVRERILRFALLLNC